MHAAMKVALEAAMHMAMQAAAQTMRAASSRCCPSRGQHLGPSLRLSGGQNTDKFKIITS